MEVLQIGGVVAFAAPLVGAIASGTGRIWGNVLTAGACAVWAGLILVAILSSGDARGPYGAMAMLLLAAAVAELVLAWELAGRREAGRTDEGIIRALSAAVGLGAMAVVVALVYLMVVAMLSFLAMLS